MKKSLFMLAIFLIGTSGSAQIIKESQILSAFQEGNYEVMECKYIYTYLKDVTTQTKFIWVKFNSGILKEATIYSAPFKKKEEMFFFAATLIVDSSSAQQLWGINEPVAIKRTKDDLLSEYCRDAVFRFNELLVATTPKTHYY